jgi:hypothetical protein
VKNYIGKKKAARIYIDNQDKYEGKPLWEVILLKAKAYGLAGATVFKGVAGMGAHSEVHSFNVLVISQELPLVIELIDDEAKVRGFLEEIEPMIEEGLTSLSDVEVITYKHK